MVIKRDVDDIFSNTDFVLIPVDLAQSAVEVLARDGWVVKMSRQN